MKYIIRISLIMGVVIFGSLYFTTVTYLSGTGEQITDLKLELMTVEKMNRKYLIGVNEKLQAPYLETYAKEHGLVTDTKFVYVPIPPSSVVVSKK